MNTQQISATGIRWTAALILVGAMLAGTGIQTAAAEPSGPPPAVALDGEALFCLYFRLSGEPMDDQSIEDYAAAAGRPLYTAFKPSEMFVKQGIKRFRRHLKRRADELGPDTRLFWQLDRTAAGAGLIELPAATELIQAEMSKADRKRLARALAAFDRQRCAADRRDLTIRIEMVPAGLNRLSEQRNIARQNVVLPMGRVRLRPVRIRIAAARSPDTALWSERF